MGEEFYSIIKLITGEEIFALVSVEENNGDPVLLLQNPIVMKVGHNTKGSYVKVSKWVELSDDDMFILKVDRIMTMTESNSDKLINIYKNFLEENDEKIIDFYKSNGKVSISDKMGYISNVEDARKKFEELYKINQEPKET